MSARPALDDVLRTQEPRRGPNVRAQKRQGTRKAPAEFPLGKVRPRPGEDLGGLVQEIRGELQELRRERAWLAQAFRRLVTEWLENAGHAFAGLLDHPLDEISRDIIVALGRRGPMSVRQLESELRSMRGRASRNTIRGRIARLVPLGLIEVREGKGSLLATVDPRVMARLLRRITGPDGDPSAPVVDTETPRELNQGRGRVIPPVQVR